MTAYPRTSKANRYSRSSHASTSLPLRSADSTTSWLADETHTITFNERKIRQVLSDFNMPSIRDMWHKHGPERTTSPPSGSSSNNSLGLSRHNAPKPLCLDVGQSAYKTRISRPLPSVPPRIQYNQEISPDELDFRPFSILEAPDLSQLPRRTSKASRVLGAPVCRMEYGSKRRAKVHVPSTLEEDPDIANEPKEFLREFANICTFSPFEPDISSSHIEYGPNDKDDQHSSPKTADVSEDQLSKRLSNLDPWKTVVYEHGPLRPNKAFGRDSFATLASWDGAWDPSMLSEDDWMDDILDDFEDVFRRDKGNSVLFPDGPFDEEYRRAMDAPLLDHRLISQLAASR